MGKKSKEKKTLEAHIKSLAGDFDRAVFNQAVTLQEVLLRGKDGLPKRVYELERVIGSRDAAFLICAEEKVRFGMRQIAYPDETEAMSKVYARAAAREGNSMYFPASITVKGRSSNWRNWGQAPEKHFSPE